MGSFLAVKLNSSSIDMLLYIWRVYCIVTQAKPWIEKVCSNIWKYIVVWMSTAMQGGVSWNVSSIEICVREHGGEKKSRKWNSWQNLELRTNAWGEIGVECKTVTGDYGATGKGTDWDHFSFPAHIASGSWNVSSGTHPQSLITPPHWSDRKPRYTWPTFLEQCLCC